MQAFRIVHERARERAEVLGGPRAQGDEPAAQIGELRESHPAFALFAAGVAEGEEAAEVLVALAPFAKQSHQTGALDFQLRTDERTDPAPPRGAVEAGRAVHAA